MDHSNPNPDTAAERADFLLDVGRGFIQAREYEKATQALEKALKFGENFSILCNLAQCYAQTDRAKSAEITARRAIALQAGKSAPYLVLANALLQQDMLAEAHAATKTAVKLDPANPYTLAIAAETALRAKQLDVAETWAKKSIKVSKNTWDPVPHLIRAQVWSIKGAYKKAIALCNKVLAQETALDLTYVGDEPPLVTARRGIAIATYLDGRARDDPQTLMTARALLQELREAFGLDFMATVALAELHHYLFHDAQSTMELLEELGPDANRDPHIVTMKGLALLDLGYADEAQQLLFDASSRSDTLYGDRLQALRFLPTALLRKREYQAAANAAVRAFEFDPQLRDAMVLNAAGGAYLRLGNLTAAKNVLTEAAAIGTDDPIPFANLARCLVKLKSFDAAIDAATQAVELGNDPRPWLTLAEARAGKRGGYSAADISSELERLNMSAVNRDEARALLKRGWLADEHGHDDDPRATTLDVLVLASEWAPRNGGISAFNAHLCASLSRVGVRVYCYVPSASAEEIQHAKDANVELLTPSHGEELSGLEAKLCLLPPLPEDADIEWIIGHGRVTGPAAKTQTQKNFPSARRMHFVHVAPGSIEWFKDSDDQAKKAEDRDRLEVSLAKQANLVVAVGPLLQREIASSLQLQIDAVHQFRPAPFPVETVQHPPAREEILVLGRLEDGHLKGLDIAAQAAGMVHNERPKVVLVARGCVEGAGATLREQLRTQSKKPGLDVRVRNYTADSERIHDDLRMASLLLMPSRSEGFGLVGLEAISFGVPTLVTDRSGLSEMLAELCPEFSSEAIVPVLDDPLADARAWGQAAQQVFADQTSRFRRARLLKEALLNQITWKSEARRLVAAMKSGGASRPNPATLVSATIFVQPASPPIVNNAYTPKVRWTAHTGIGSWKNKPVAVGEHILVPSCGKQQNSGDDLTGIYCLDASSGSTKWFIGLQSDPNAIALADDRAFVGTDDGTVICMALDGTELWRSRSSGPVLAEPLVTPRGVLVLSSRGQGKLLDPTNGSLINFASFQGGVVANPTVADGRIYIVSRSGWVYDLPFDDPLPDSLAAQSARSGGGGRSTIVTYPNHHQAGGRAPCQFHASPICFDDLLVLAYARDTYFGNVPIAALRRDSLEPAWTEGITPQARQFGNIRATPVVAGGQIIAPVAYGSDVIGLTRDGTVSWVTECGEPYFPQWGSPETIGNFAIVPRFDGLLHLVSSSGFRTWSLDLRGKNEAAVIHNYQWDFRREQARWNNPNSSLNSPALVSDGHIYVTSTNGTTFAISLKQGDD